MLIAQIFPLKDRMELVAHSKIDDNAARKHAVNLEAERLKLRYPHLFWNEAETEQMETLWDIQRRERKVNAENQLARAALNVRNR